MKFLKGLLLFTVLQSISFGVNSQDLKVFDYSTKQPLSGVHIYNVSREKSVITDSTGIANVSIFEEEDLLIFSHTAFVEVLFKKKDLYTSHYVLELHPKVLDLDEFVISANKRIQAREEVPNKIVSITDKDIRLADPQTAADLLGSSGEVFIQKSQLGGGSPMIRGFSANRVLLVVDGVRMNNAIFRGGNLQNVISIDPNVVEKSEIVFGPGSVIYGSDALGGVMDFQTISNTFSDSGKVFKGNAMVRYSSANSEITPHVDFSFGLKKFSSVSSITWSKFSDLKMGSQGPDEYLRNDFVITESGMDMMEENPNPKNQVFSGYEQLSLMQKFGYKFSERITADYSFLYSTTSDIPRYDRLIQRKDENTLKYARWDYGPQRWMMNKLTLNVNAPNSFFDNLRVTMALQNFEESRIDRKFNDPNLRIRTETVDLFSINMDFDNIISGRTTMYYGFESVYNIVGSHAVSDSNGVQENVVTRYPNDSRYYSNAGYLNFQVNHSKRTTVVYGLRYNHVGIIAQFDTNFYKSLENSKIDQHTGALTGSIGTAFRPNPSWQLNANVSSGFKAPNIDDMAKLFDSQPGNVVVPNPDLNPEYLYSVDMIIGKKFGEDFKHKIEFSSFYSYLVDAIVQRPFSVNGQDSIIYDGELSQVESLVNVGSAFITGVNLKWNSDFSKNWSTSIGMTYTYGKDDEGFYLRHVSPFFADAHVIYSKNKLRVDAYLIYNGKIPHSRMAPTELDKDHIYLQDENGNLYSPNWYTLNVKSSYQLNKMLMITAGVENITDQRYRAYSSGIVGPGFNFIGSLKATF